MSSTLFIIIAVMLARLPEILPVLAPLHLGRVVVVIGVLLVAMGNPRGFKTLFSGSHTGKWLLAIYILAFVGIPFSIWRSGALESFIGLSKTLLLTAVLVALAENGRAGMLRRACMFSVLLLALLMIFDKGTGRLQVGDTYDPNDIALFFVVFLPIIAAEALAGRKLLSITAWSAVACSIIGIALTQSRGGLLALAAVGALSLLFIKKRRMVAIIMLCCGLLIFIGFADDSFWQRFSELSSGQDYNMTADTGRIAIWKAGIGLMFTYPLFGIGIGQFGTGLGTLVNGIYMTAHNSFIQIGTELGLPGLIAFVGLLLSVARSSRRWMRSARLPQKEKTRQAALLLSLAGYCVGGFFLSQAYGGTLYVFLALAVTSHAQAVRTAAERQCPVQSGGAGQKFSDVPRAEDIEGITVLGGIPGRTICRAAANNAGASRLAGRESREALLKAGDELFLRNRKKPAKGSDES